MSDYFIGEIRLFVGMYPPSGWNLCDGTLLKISEYQALYSLIGTTYGGDGVNNFALPDLRGRIPISQGQGPGLTNRVVAQAGGSETATLTAAQLPAHTHFVLTAGTNATTPNLGTSVMFANTASPVTQYLKSGLGTTGGTAVQPAAPTISTTGSGQPHQNVMPSAILTYMIALNGTYPMRA